MLINSISVQKWKFNINELIFIKIFWYKIIGSKNKKNLLVEEANIIINKDIIDGLNISLEAKDVT